MPVPTVLGVESGSITMTRVPIGRPSASAARRFGDRLATLHHAGAHRFGAPWPGFIGPLPMANSGAGDWPTFYAEQRVLPFVSMAEERGAIGARDAEDVRRALRCLPRLPGIDEAPSRLHGDLWSGNVLWGADDEVWLVDPAAHGGHRETDLAMLALFGCPHLEEILVAYQERHPLAPGWRQRVPIHQLHPLAVHAVLFGGGYGSQAGEAARSALSALGGDR